MDLEHEQRLTAVEERSKSNSHRLDKLEESNEVISRLVDAVLALPTIFWIDCSDATLLAAAWLGLILSVLALLGVTNALF